MPLNFGNVPRQDVVAEISQAIRMYPADKNSTILTGIPEHLKAPHLSKTSASSGASLYMCPHPKCDPAFIAKGSPGPLYNHMRRHHLGICIACPYCPREALLCSGGMEKTQEEFHKGVVWYGSALAKDQEEATEADELLTQLEQDPAILSTQARREETTLLEAYQPDVRVVIASDEVLEAAAQEEETVPDLPLEETPAPEYLEPVPAECPGYLYASRSAKADAFSTHPGVECRDSVGVIDDPADPEMDPTPPYKKAKKE